MPEKRIKARVTKDKYGNVVYRGEYGQRYTHFDATREFERQQDINKEDSRHHKGRLTKPNPFEGLAGYTGDYIGKIHIAALIPHFKRKKKRT